MIKKFLLWYKQPNICLTKALFAQYLYKMESHWTWQTFSFALCRWSERWVMSAFWWTTLVSWQEKSSWMLLIPLLRRQWRSTLWLISGSVRLSRHGEMSARKSLHIVSLALSWGFCVVNPYGFLWRFYLRKHWFTGRLGNILVLVSPHSAFLFIFLVKRLCMEARLPYWNNYSFFWWLF